MGEIEKAPLLCSHRMLLAIMAFMGNFFIYCTRVNLSVAIVCMVRDSMKNATNSSLDLLVSTAAPADQSGCGPETDADGQSESNEHAEFDWDKTMTGNLLAMYFYGYIFTQIPGGWLASRYGGKRVWGVCQAVCAISTLLTPLCARTSVYLAYALRFLLGFAAGVTFPAVHALLGRWSPPLERSKITSVTFAGPLVGNVVTFSVSGLLCAYGFDNGWGSIFYLAGIGNLVWVVAWFWLVADSPEKHKHISEKEMVYITASIGKGAVKKVRRVPWLSMITSGPLWAVIIAHMSNNYLNYTLLTSLPTFMKESLNFDVKENGALSALPYVCQFVGSIVVGHVADTMREKQLMSTKNVRKLFQTISLGGSGICLAIVGQMNCEHRYLAVGVLCICTFLLSANRAGYVSNHLDLAPSYAGVLYGITNTGATVPGMVAPIITGALTPDGTADEWRSVFYVCAAVVVAGMILYLLLADGELQAWAVPKEGDYEVTVDVDSVKDVSINSVEVAQPTEKALEAASVIENSTKL
ncbi:vesicular glutamate transporter 2 [Plakobranchus ocellatus]|uniref:Sialin n=1 Tax=Plakobranchus ocellatus TaxID=259542 RepID=A0AAV4B9L2_9GAST|nr:vesicular glutamate transporter 2 [Plakobranchus ocellatus]